MKEIKFEFKSNGEKVKVKAILDDSLTKLSKSKHNQATDIIPELYNEESSWALFFSISDTKSYEVELKLDAYGEKTLTPVKAITWENDIITDVQAVKIKH